MIGYVTLGTNKYDFRDLDGNKLNAFCRTDG